MAARKELIDAIQECMHVLQIVADQGLTIHNTTDPQMKEAMLHRAHSTLRQRATRIKDSMKIVNEALKQPDKNF